MRLTLAGQVLLKHSRHIFEQIEEARKEIASLTEETDSLVRIGTIQSMNYRLIPTAITMLQESSPNIHVRVSELSGELLEECVAKEELDVGIGFLPAIRDDLVTEHLFSEEMYLVVNRSHPLANEVTIDFKLLNGLEMALLSERYISRQLFDSAALRASIRPKIMVETNTTMSLLVIAQVSRLAVVLPKAAVTEWFMKEVSLITLKNPSIQRSVGFVWSKTSVRNDAALSLATCIRSQSTQNAFCIPTEKSS